MFILIIIYRASQCVSRDVSILLVIQVLELYLATVLFSNIFYSSLVKELQPLARNSVQKQYSIKILNLEYTSFQLQALNAVETYLPSIKLSIFRYINFLNRVLKKNQVASAKILKAYFLSVILILLLSLAQLISIGNSIFSKLVLKVQLYYAYYQKLRTILYFLEQKSLLYQQFQL